MRGQLWVIEGADGSGKKTHAEILVRRLNESGKLGKNSAHFKTFPTYDDPVWGKLIKEYLSNTAGRAVDFDPKYTALLYAADRGKAAPKLKELLGAGDCVICDRFTPSNLAFQGAKIKDIGARDEFISWLEDMEYNYFQIPKPHGVIYLSLPIEISMKRTESRRQKAIEMGEALGDKIKEADIHEQDKEYLANVGEEYNRLANSRNWHVITGVEGGRELSVEEVSEKIWSMVARFI